MHFLVIAKTVNRDSSRLHVFGQCIGERIIIRITYEITYRFKSQNFHPKDISQCGNTVRRPRDSKAGKHRTGVLDFLRGAGTTTNRETIFVPDE